MSRPSVHTYTLTPAALAAGMARAPRRPNTAYYAGIVRNRLRIRVPFQYRVNGGPWVTVHLPAGYSMVFAAQEPRSAVEVDVRFDNRIDNRVTLTTARLAMHGCGSPYDGWLQNFITVNDGKDVVLAR